MEPCSHGFHLSFEEKATHVAFTGKKIPPDVWEVGIIGDVEEGQKIG